MTLSKPVFPNLGSVKKEWGSAKRKESAGDPRENRDKYYFRI